MKNKRLVSVIIPTYNRADKIDAAIRSAISQTYGNTEIIVIDDGSDDHTREVAARFPGVNYFVQEHAGQAAARNNGLGRARGSLIASLDSDDTWHPDFLQTCVAKLEHDRLDFVFANWLQQYPDNQSRDFLTTFAPLAPFIKQAQDGWVNMNHTELKALYLSTCPSPSSSMLIRKSSIVSGWTPKINIGDDWCLMLDMILHKECKAAFCLQRLWTKQVHTLNIYDGRAWNEVMELLYVNDLYTFLSRYKHLLNEDEMKTLGSLHQKGLLNLAMYHLLKKRNISRSLQLVRKSLSMGAGQTFRLFPGSLKTCLELKLKTLNLLYAGIK